MDRNPTLRGISLNSHKNPARQAQASYHMGEEGRRGYVPGSSDPGVTLSPDSDAPCSFCHPCREKITIRSTMSLVSETISFFRPLFRSFLSSTAMAEHIPFFPQPEGTPTSGILPALTTGQPLILTSCRPVSAKTIYGGNPFRFCSPAEKRKC